MAEPFSGFFKGVRNDIFDSLEDLGYSGPMLNSDTFQKAIEIGPKSVDFTAFVVWLTTQLNCYAGLEEHVCSTTELSDIDTFLMELSGFLREYGCPYRSLCEGPLQERFLTVDSNLLLIDYLLTELQAAKITTVNCPLATTPHSKTDSVSKTLLVAEQLRELLECLGVREPEEEIVPSEFCAHLQESISSHLQNNELNPIGKPLLTDLPSDDEWKEIEYVSQALEQDYSRRRQMVIQRLDVTIQSFRWSEQLQNKDDRLNSVYRSVRSRMAPAADLDVAHLLAARDDLLQIEKTSGGSARERTKCGINRILIGKVPDRGGRPRELDRPPPEMPAFQQRKQQRGSGNWSHGGQDRRRPPNEKPSGGWQDTKRRR